MTHSTQRTFTCPCGEVFDTTIYDSVNVAQDPQLLYTVLAGLLNVATCPSCGRRAAIAHPYIFSDRPHGLLAYVHPRHDVPEEGRLMILEKLRGVYERVVGDVEEHANQEATGDSSSIEPGEAEQFMEAPPLQVVFGSDQLHELINSTLSQDERLGKLALNTHSNDSAERGQFLDIARKLARDMQCQTEVEDLPGDYTVWIYGPRRKIGAIMRELATRS